MAHPLEAFREQMKSSAVVIISDTSRRYWPCWWMSQVYGELCLGPSVHIFSVVVGTADAVAEGNARRASAVVLMPLDRMSLRVCGARAPWFPEVALIDLVSSLCPKVCGICVPPPLAGGPP